LFRSTQKFIAYFDSSLAGLNPGAPVKMRGVTIGSVAEVLIAHNQKTNDYAMPVILEVDLKMLQDKSDRVLVVKHPLAAKHLVKRGLRARLASESLVTGVLYVELEMKPNGPSEPNDFHQLTEEYVEIPTDPSDIKELIASMQKLLANLGRFDIPGLSDKLNALLSRLDTRVSELNMGQINAGLTNLIASVDRVVSSADLTNSLAELRLALVDTRALIKRVDNRVDPLADSATNTLAEAQRAIAELRLGIQSFTSLAEPDAPLRADLRHTLENLAAAAAALSDLADFLRRNPNAILTGRKPSQTQP
jgi:paraquat-inducible protein B